MLFLFFKIWSIVLGSHGQNGNVRRKNAHVMLLKNLFVPIINTGRFLILNKWDKYSSTFV